MDPLCISLVHQYLNGSNSALADQFKDEYQPQKSNVQVKEVLSKWKEEQLVRGLIYQHLRTVAPSLAVEFRDTHWCSLEPTPKHLEGEIQKRFLAITSFRANSNDESGAKEEQRNDGKKSTFTTEELVKSLVYEHLKTVAPSLAVEFRNTHFWCSETVPKMGEVQKKHVGVLFVVLQQEI